MSKIVFNFDADPATMVCIVCQVTKNVEPCARIKDLLAQQAEMIVEHTTCQFEGLPE